MSYILHIETSTPVCSVALAGEHEGIVWEKVSFEGPSHAALAGVFVEEALEWLKARQQKPIAVAVSGGPGSYTGLRIGVSLAKGLCFGYDIPLIAIPTLKILASQAVSQPHANPEMLYCPMLDARRMEVYSALYDAKLNTIQEVKAEIIDEFSYASLLETRPICFFGNGAAKCREVIKHINAHFPDDLHPLAAGMAPLAWDMYRLNQFEDVAYFDPFYLKDFVATVAKNKVLGNHQNK